MYLLDTVRSEDALYYYISRRKPEGKEKREGSEDTSKTSSTKSLH